MDKLDWKPGTLLYPLPVVLVSLGAHEEEYNIITIAWTGTICSDPPMCSISLRRERHSHAILQRTREFVINLTTESLAFATDWCGVRSGRQYRKFEEMGLHPAPALKVKAPIIAEAPMHLECEVRQVLPLGSHDMFLAEVVNIKADARYLNPKTGAFDLALARPIAYVHGHYFGLGRKIGGFGFSVRKKKSQPAKSHALSKKRRKQ